MSGFFTGGTSKLGKVAANPTGAPILVEHGVSWRVLVAVFAVGFLSIPLARIATSDIFGASDRLHMLRVRATPDPAQVIQLESGRYRSNQLFECGAVSHRGGSVFTELPITSIVDNPNPEPASAIRFGDDIRKKEIEPGHSRHCNAKGKG